MTAIDRLNALLQNMKNYEENMKGNMYSPASPHAVMTVATQMVNELEWSMQQLETAIIELEG
mgnify:CR=1 FL=1